MLTDNEIRGLIESPKKIIDKQFKPIIDGKHSAATAELECLNATGNFQLFIRQHTEFGDNFSIGLNYQNSGKKYLLIRVNGSTTHHKIVHHRTPHVHLLTEDDIENGRESKPSKIEYNIPCVSFKEAILYFVKRVNINNHLDYFGNLFELGLFE